jgi:hypothetical protein
MRFLKIVSSSRLSGAVVTAYDPAAVTTTVPALRMAENAAATSSGAMMPTQMIAASAPCLYEGGPLVKSCVRILTPQLINRRVSAAVSSG